MILKSFAFGNQLDPEIIEIVFKKYENDYSNNILRPNSISIYLEWKTVAPWVDL